MPSCTELGVKYHTQDQPCFCGPAVVQMVMSYLGTAIELLDQDKIFGMILAADPSWSGGVPGSSPVGIVSALEYYRRAAISDQRPPFTATSLWTREDVAWRVANAVAEDNAAPPIVLTHGCDHWEVVTGVRWDDDPALEGAPVLGFSMNSPVLATSLNAPPPPPPPPHADDDECGSGGGYGTAHEYVTFEGFLERLDACPQVAGGQYIVIDDQPPTPTRPLRASPRALYRGRSALRSLWSADGYDSDELGEAALAGLAAHGLGDAFFADRPAGLADPVLVKRLDRFDSYYVLVAVVADDGRRIGHARIDVRSAQLLGATASPTRVVPERTEFSVENVLCSSVWDCASPREPFRPGTCFVHPTLVWRPCLESPSPYQPFRQINVPGGILYQAVNGTIFWSLTPFNGCGGGP
jgi:hypothetical protein